MVKASKTKDAEKKASEANVDKRGRKERALKDNDPAPPLRDPIARPDKNYTHFSIGKPISLSRTSVDDAPQGKAVDDKWDALLPSQASRIFGPHGEASKDTSANTRPQGPAEEEPIWEPPPRPTLILEEVKRGCLRCRSDRTAGVNMLNHAINTLCALVSSPQSRGESGSDRIASASEQDHVTKIQPLIKSSVLQVKDLTLSIDSVCLDLAAYEAQLKAFLSNQGQGEFLEDRQFRSAVSQLSERQLAWYTRWKLFTDVVVYDNSSFLSQIAGPFGIGDFANSLRYGIKEVVATNSDLVKAERAEADAWNQVAVRDPNMSSGESVVVQPEVTKDENETSSLSDAEIPRKFNQQQLNAEALRLIGELGQSYTELSNVTKKSRNYINKVAIGKANATPSFVEQLKVHRGDPARDAIEQQVINELSSVPTSERPIVCRKLVEYLGFLKREHRF